MSIFGKGIFPINELDVPTDDEGTDYGNIDDDAAAGDAAAGADEGETDYNLPEDDEGGEEDPTADEGDDTNYDLPDEEEDDGEQTEDPTDDGEEGDNPEGDETDYDLPEDGGEEGDGTEDTGEEDPAEGDTTEEEPIDNAEDEDLTEDLFKDLTAEQKAIRDKALLNNYYEMYTTVSDLELKLQKVPRNGNILHKIDYISNSVSDLKKILYDYIISTFSTKSYLENHKNYYEFISTFANINKMLEKLGEKEDK